ncbi:glycosyltransferase family 39 protein [Ideonella sp.]|uniref:ArnT family glycosyltransferase n=1 Tax=Ideonella sp. TaxID=1929293 RepID=UPI002B49F169|nr:glycosyltransferase family 39 protein [Ideonella sp.]HJV71002.1 glycosyltransferase family 39 protein [Ideonella sp.]
MRTGTRCDTSRSWQPRTACQRHGWADRTTARGLVLLLIGLTIWRAWIVVHAGAGLHVDEAQYWAWAQSLDWGYYSKPPAIAALIALSTAWLGDGILGVKALAMLCYPLTAWVLFRWIGEVVADVSGPGVAQPARAGRLAALLFIASPVAGLLGLAATTDAPLLLAWSLASYALWRAWRDGRRADWLMLGLWVGLGLMSKYTMAAFVVSAVGLLVTVPRARPAGLPLGRGLLIAALAATACVAPNLAWNAAHGWPTLRHTAEITVGAQAAPLHETLGTYVVGLLLLVGPVLAPWALIWRLGRPRVDAVKLVPASRCAAAAAACPTRRDAAFAAAWLSGPLAAIGGLQALHAQAELNWAAPVLIGAILALVLWLRPEQPGRRLGGWYAALATQALLLGALTLAGDIAHALHRPLPRQLDVWARMRGWEQAFEQLRPAAEAWWRREAGTLAGRPSGPLVLGADRAVLANGAYAWRAFSPRWTAWRDAGQPPHDHFQLQSPLEPGEHPQRILIVSAGAPDPAWRARLDGPPRRLAIAEVEQTPGRMLHIELWQAELASRPMLAQAARGGRVAAPQP